jgi:hypothetical protein
MRLILSRDESDACVTVYSHDMMTHDITLSIHFPLESAQSAT